ncbi:MAG: hypothetical protein KGJ13_07075 [Patescibacteria group bacterium]|nr:hypothetical protein [Patescibacteria group bacterium]
MRRKRKRKAQVIINFKPWGISVDQLGTGKSQATLIGGAIATIVIWSLNTYVLHPPMPDYIGTAITTIICYACAYWTPHNASVANLVPGKGK